MADEKNLASARAVYKTLCDAIEKRGWRYQKDDEKLFVVLSVIGEDLPMEFQVTVDVERQLVRLISPFPFTISENKRAEGAVAACVATYGLVDGSFDCNPLIGTIRYRMTASFKESLIGEGVFHYMFSCAGKMIDRYNDKFLAIDKGLLSISDFIASEGKPV